MKSSTVIRSGGRLSVSAARIIAAALFITIFTATPGCNETDPAGNGGVSGDISSNLVYVSGCMDQIQAEESAMVTPTQECFEYSYDGEDVLTVKHIDFALNCCPGDIVATVAIEDDVISIVETEGPGSMPCDCICLYHTEIEITGIPPGLYRIVFDDFYTGGDPALEATFLLAGQATGRFCEDRSFYPWN